MRTSCFLRCTRGPAEGAFAVSHPARAMNITGNSPTLGECPRDCCRSLAHRGIEFRHGTRHKKIRPERGGRGDGGGEGVEEAETRVRYAKIKKPYIRERKRKKETEGDCEKKMKQLPCSVGAGRAGNSRAFNPETPGIYLDLKGPTRSRLFILDYI